MTFHTPVTPKERESIRADISAGLSVKETVARSGRSLTSVRLHTADLRPKSRKGRKTSLAVRRQIREYAGQGYSATEIAEWSDTSVYVVRRYAGDLLAEHCPTQDISRLRRMIAARKSADYGNHDEIAHRFGLAHGDSLRNVIAISLQRLRKRGLLPADLAQEAA